MGQSAAQLHRCWLKLAEQLTTHVHRTALLAVVVALAFQVACRRGADDAQSPRVQHKLFKDLKAPPVNFPRPVRAARDTVDVPTSLREGSFLILRDAKLFEGNINLSGQATMADGRIEFMAQNQSPLEIRYRLPKQLPSPPPYKGIAEFSVLDASDPGGPDRQVLIRSGSALLLAAVMKKSAEPNRVEITPGVFVNQSTVEVNAKVRIAPSRIEARGADGTVTVIPVGELTSARMGGVVLNLFITASYRVMSAEGEQHEGGYILEGWAVRSSQP